ncbi:hypothetical protein [Dipodfec virus UOA04_Rod_446]|nr:hypothetical protein [Dipodfec virus UOA04_Rod_446]
MISHGFNITFRRTLMDTPTSYVVEYSTILSGKSLNHILKHLIEIRMAFSALGIVFDYKLADNRLAGFVDKAFRYEDTQLEIPF